MKLTFSQPKIVDRFTFKDLTPILQKQFELVGDAVLGESNPQEIFAQCEPEERVWELYNVVDEQGNVLFDAWVLGVDDGCLFEYGTLNDTSFALIQSSFADTLEEGEDSEERAKWVEALDEAYNEASHFDDEEDAWGEYWEEFSRKLDEEESNN
jgi:hypothetical protein